MDVGYCEYQGNSLAWIPPTMLPGPWYFEHQESFGWLRSALGGFCNSCGMIHIGNPETDDVSYYNFPARSKEISSNMCFAEFVRQRRARIFRCEGRKACVAQSDAE